MAVAGKWKLHLLSSRGDDAVTGIAGHITGILANLVSDGSRYSHDFKEATGPGNLQRRAIYLSGLSVRENPRPSKPANKKETAVGGLFFWVGLWLGPSAVAKSHGRRVNTGLPQCFGKAGHPGHLGLGVDELLSVREEEADLPGGHLDPKTAEGGVLAACHRLAFCKFGPVVGPCRDLTTVRVDLDVDGHADTAEQSALSGKGCGAVRAVVGRREDFEGRCWHWFLGNVVDSPGPRLGPWDDGDVWARLFLMAGIVAGPDEDVGQYESAVPEDEPQDVYEAVEDELVQLRAGHIDRLFRQGCLGGHGFIV